MANSQHSRRRFLKTGAAIFGGLLIGPTASFASKVLEEDFSDWLNILEYAVWTPSPHNMQPWKIELISPTKAKLYYDTNQLLPAGDPQFKFMTMTMGTFLEYMNIAAKSFGQEIVHSKDIKKISCDNSGVVFFCDIDLTNAKNQADFHPKFIKSRKTSRLNYTGETVPNYVMDTLSNDALKYGHRLSYASDKKLTSWLTDLNQRALFHDLNKNDVRQEIDELMRYNENEAEEHKDGLSAKCMQFPGRLLKSVIQEHEKWTKGTRAKILKKTYKSAFGGSRTICWIEGKWESPEELIQAGKMLGRLWLRIESAGYVIQPLGSLITNPMAHKEIAKKLNADESDDSLWFIMRIGKSAEAPRSKRFTVNSITSLQTTKSNRV